MAELTVAELTVHELTVHELTMPGAPATATASWADLSYSPVTATSAPNFATALIPGYRLSERRELIGHGSARWEWACREVLSWGIKRRAGFVVQSAAVAAEVRVGDTVCLVLGTAPFRVREFVRVVYLVNEPTRRGFAYGTLLGHPLRGEDCFLVDRMPDGTVWLTVRSFSRPSTPLWMVLTPLLRLAQAIAVRRYFAALSARMS
ncbi:MAG: DUF1990 domain-containing protein [Microbacteriaceae bacterium]|nr:DUF1990 domain-containing protein [Microbacteriaceae bacterium]